MNRPRQSEGRPHVLYRMFDQSGQLLYIGLTLAVPDRFAAHRHDKPWWTTVTSITMEHFASRHDVEDAERDAIFGEQPLYNVQHKARNHATTSRSTPAEVPRLSQETGPIVDQYNAGCEATLTALRAMEDPEAAIVQERAALSADSELMNQLNQLLRDDFGELHRQGWSYAELARRFGMSKSRAQQLANNRKR